MTTYNELISRFEVYDNPPCKKGYDRHHIVPESEQKRLYGSVTDNRQIYVSLPMHMWLHILYDRENGTKTAKKFLDICGKPQSFFTCYELCLAYSYTLRKKREEGDKKLAEVRKTLEYRKKLSDSLKGICRSEETKQKIAERTREAMNRPEVRQKVSDSMKGEKNPMYGQHHSEESRRKMSDSQKGLNTWSRGQKFFNDGTKNVRAYECPEGFVSGRLKRIAV